MGQKDLNRGANILSINLEKCAQSVLRMQSKVTVGIPSTLEIEKDLAEV